MTREWLDFWLCRNSQPFKGPTITICGLIRFLCWEFVYLPVLRWWYRRRPHEDPDSALRLRAHLDARDSRRPLTSEQKQRLRDILQAEEMQEYPDSRVNGHDPHP